MEFFCRAYIVTVSIPPLHLSPAVRVTVMTLIVVYSHTFDHITVDVRDPETTFPSEYGPFKHLDCIPGLKLIR